MGSVESERMAGWDLAAHPASEPRSPESPHEPHRPALEWGQASIVALQSGVLAEISPAAFGHGDHFGPLRDLTRWRFAGGDRRRMEWCPGAESNHRHCDFQSHALPTELPGRSGRDDIADARRRINLYRRRDGVPNS